MKFVRQLILYRDDESKRVYINLLNCRMRGEYPSEEVMEKGIPYFSFGHF